MKIEYGKPFNYGGEFVKYFSRKMTLVFPELVPELPELLAGAGKVTVLPPSRDESDAVHLQIDLKEPLQLGRKPIRFVPNYLNTNCVTVDEVDPRHLSAPFRARLDEPVVDGQAVVRMSVILEQMDYPEAALPELDRLRDEVRHFAENMTNPWVEIPRHS